MPYVVGYKGRRIWIKSKTCKYCDYYEPSDKECTIKEKKVRGDRKACTYFAPRGQGGGE